MNKLTDFDLKILKYINKFDEIHINQIKTKFSKTKHSIDYRIGLLSTKTKDETDFCFDDNSSYIQMNYKKVKTNLGLTSEPLNTYSITEKGKKFLLDQKILSRKESQKTFKCSY